MAAGLNFLEGNYGKMTLWEWTREWIELEMQSEEDEHIDLLEYLYLRAGNADEDVK